jgi:hypothetical protein
MDTLKVQGVITQRVFALLFSNESFINSEKDSNSEVIIGDEAYAYMTDSLIYIPLQGESHYWAVELVAVYLGLINLTISTQIASFDSNSAVIRVPHTDYLALIEGMSAYGSCRAADLIRVVCDCFRYPAALYPDLELTLAGHNVTLTYEDYFVQSNGECVLLAVQDEEVERWVLGTVVMRGRLVVFDMEGRKVGLGEISMSEVVEIAICVLLV